MPILFVGFWFAYGAFCFSYADKIGMVGTAYMLLWRHDAKKYAHFLDAALNCAETLSKTMNHDTSETRSPWPFRVYAETGIVRQAYSSNVLFNIDLFDQLIALNSTASPNLTPDVKEQFQQTREEAWAFLVEFPLKNGNWCGYCVFVADLPELHIHDPTSV
jgi:hypothetical protein